MKVKILVNDPAGRFRAGEIGDILQNTFPEKYAYFIRLPGIEHADNFMGRGSIDVYRDYYFYADEVELLKDQ